MWIKEGRCDNSKKDSVEPSGKTDVLALEMEITPREIKDHCKLLKKHLTVVIAVPLKTLVSLKGGADSLSQN